MQLCTPSIVRICLYLDDRTVACSSTLDKFFAEYEMDADCVWTCRIVNMYYVDSAYQKACHTRGRRISENIWQRMGWICIKDWKTYTQNDLMNK